MKQLSRETSGKLLPTAGYQLIADRLDRESFKIHTHAFCKQAEKDRHAAPFQKTACHCYEDITVDTDVPVLQSAL
jgi:hypothetical protein